MAEFYVLVVWMDVEPELIGPYRSPGWRDRKARVLKKEHGDEHGVYWVDVMRTRLGCQAETGSYSGDFFEGV